MTGLLLSGLLLAQTPVLPATTTVAPPAPRAAAEPAEPAAPPTLSPLHTAQVDAHLARLRALRAELQLQQLVLNQERDTLDAAIRAAHPGYAPDWRTGHLVAVPPAAESAEAPKDDTP